MKSHLISVTGSKDSSGSTTLSINLAYLMQKLGKRVLLVDYDLNFQGDITNYLRLNKTACHFADLIPLLEKKVSRSLIEGFIPKHSTGIEVVQALSTTSQTNTFFSHEQIQNLIRMLSEIYDIIIFDMGSHLTPLHIVPLQKSSKIYVVSLAQSACLGKTQTILSQLMHLYLSKERIEVLINRFQNHLHSDEEVATHLEGFKTEKFFDAGNAHAQAFQTGVPLAFQDVRHDFTLALENKVRSQWIDHAMHSPPEGEIVLNGVADLTPFWAQVKTDTVSQSEILETSSIDNNNASLEWNELKGDILKKLLQVIDLRGIDVSKKKDLENEKKLREKAKEAILKIINEIDEKNFPTEKRQQLVEEVLNEAIGLGPLENLLSDKDITEIMINGKDRIYIEKSGKLQRTSMRFSSNAQLNSIIERIVAPIGRRVDESTPLVDARLSDGSRVNIIIPPLSLVGPSVTIRRFSETPFQAADLVRFGSLNPNMVDFLKAAIEARLNIIVSGGTGSGKTTLLNVLSSFIPSDERIVTLEDSAELQLTQDHVVSLESRPANIEGEGEIPIRTLLKNTLRMRPDRIVVGECRGGEALDMLQAMNTGHDGSLTTIHANTPRDCVSRLETLVMYSGIQLPSRAIRSQIASAIHLIVQLNRISDGSRKITKITEVAGMEGDIITLQDIFEFKQEGLNSQRKVIGKHRATGFIPRFVDSLQEKGIATSREIFSNS